MEAPENELYLRASYGTVQAIALAVIAWIYLVIKNKNDKTPFNYNETKNPFDKEYCTLTQFCRSGSNNRWGLRHVPG